MLFLITVLKCFKTYWKSKTQNKCSLTPWNTSVTPRFLWNSVWNSFNHRPRIPTPSSRFVFSRSYHLWISYTIYLLYCTYAFYMIIRDLYFYLVLYVSFTAVSHCQAVAWHTVGTQEILVEWMNIISLQPSLLLTVLPHLQWKQPQHHSLPLRQHETTSKCPLF